MGVRVRFHRGAWWIFINHQGKRRAKRIGDRDAALKVAAAARERLARGDLRIGPTNDETLEAYAGVWVRGLTGNLKASTVGFYQANLDRYILPVLGRRPVGTLNRADCRMLVAALRAKGLKLNTVKGIARTLSTLLSQAVEDEKLPANPALRLGKYLRPGDEAEMAIQPLSAAEVAHLVAVAKRHYPRWHPWTLCALARGCVSENCWRSNGGISTGTDDFSPYSVTSCVA